MIHVIGDIHGVFRSLKQISQNIPKEDVIIQVGDFGFWPHLKDHWDSFNFDRPIYFIDGNHDHHPSFKGISEETELWNNAIYVPRGTVKNIENKNILFMGGAASVDGKWRTRNVNWFPFEEIILQENIDRVPKNIKIDLIISHTPPQSCINANFDHRVLEERFDLSRHWIDNSAVLLDNLWSELNRPPIICGHMHTRLNWHNVTILDIGEVIRVSP